MRNDLPPAGNMGRGGFTGKSEGRTALRSQDLDVQRRSSLLGEGRDVHEYETFLVILAWDPEETHGRGSCLACRRVICLDVCVCVCVKPSQDWREGVTLECDAKFMRRDCGFESRLWWTTERVVVGNI